MYFSYKAYIKLIGAVLLKSFFETFETIPFYFIIW